MFIFHELDQNQYNSLLFSTISRTEEKGGIASLTPYFDSKGKPTIGYGMNLRDEGIFNKIVTDIFGVQPSEIYYQELKDIIFTKSKEYYPDESRLLSDLDRIMRNRVSDVAITLGNKRPEFSFNDASEVRPIFDAIRK